MFQFSRLQVFLVLGGTLALGMPIPLRGAEPKGKDPTRESRVENRENREMEEFLDAAAPAFRLGIQAYIYGYPLVLMEKTKQRMTTPDEAHPGTWAPLNRFRYTRKLATPESRTVVCPNADTLYAVAWLDLAKEPQILTVPAMDRLPGGRFRYFAIQMLDAWTNNFAYVGLRATGPRAGSFAIVGPQWKGTLPDGVKKIRSPTNTVWLIARTLVEGEDDLPRVRALHEHYTLSSLSQWGHPEVARTEVPATPARPVQAGSLQSLTNAREFFEVFGLALDGNPPPEEEGPLVKRYREFAQQQPAASRNGYPTLGLALGLEAAAAAALKLVEAKAANLGTTVNGWTLNSRTGRYGYDYLLRAAVAWGSLGANVPEEAVYPVTLVDGSGQPLHGSHRYCLHFDKMPPVDGFWSVTMYGKDRFLVANPRARYAIGDRTPGLTFNQDGSLDVWIQNQSPGGKETNWLPAPADGFLLMLRAFLPKKEMLNGEYVLPPVRRVD